MQTGAVIKKTGNPIAGISLCWAEQPSPGAAASKNVLLSQQQKPNIMQYVKQQRKLYGSQVLWKKLEDLIKDGKLSFVYVPTEENPADLFTKNLKSPALRQNYTKLGL
ncbi:hypothetical protein LAZ67_12000176 [Cordylochernes scorpioides]|uniref:Uncharacterized protein n=1 Tax=Cordylochernes scorpioides TaxID=51811 RepID=A0ABY6L257_9ARAC|nr:hypothetical protein LAZ67_12000176 [Cordylochernes scorpioides]